MRIQEKSKLLEFYHERSIAYGRLFDEKSPFTEVVLNDLAKFCRAHESTFDLNTDKASYLAGRRDVWLHIQEFLTLNAEQLLEKNTRPVTMTETPVK